MNKLTKLEIINETAEFYTNDPSQRAVNDQDTMCYYKHPLNGKKCSAGRCFDENSKFYELCLNTSTSIYGLELDIRKSLGIEVEPCPIELENLLPLGDSFEIDKLFLPQYQGHDLVFWDKIQELHDQKRYWSKRGLTNDGEQYLNELKIKYETNKEIVYPI